MRILDAQQKRPSGGGVSKQPEHAESDEERFGRRGIAYPERRKHRVTLWSRQIRHPGEGWPR